MRIKVNISLKAMIVLFVMIIIIAAAACVIEDDPLRIGIWDNEHIKWDNAAWGD